MGEAGEIGNAYGNLGNAYISLGDFKKAIEYYQLDLKIAKDLERRGEEGRACGNLGSAYRRLGDFNKAIHYHEIHLEITKEIGDKSGEGAANANLGIFYDILGDFTKALNYHKVHLKISKELGDRDGEGKAYGNIGLIYRRLGDFENAIKYHELSLAIAKEVGNRVGEGKAYGGLGSAYNSLGDFHKAIELRDRQLKIAKDVGDRVGEGHAYYGLGRNLELLCSLDEALACYQSSIKTLNGVRFLLQSEDEWKITLRNEYQNVYTAFWRVLLRQGKIEEALVAVEEGRAQGLNDLMQTRYGLEASLDAPRVQEKTVSCILSCISSTTVIHALSWGVVYAWVCNEGEPVHFWNKKIDDRDEQQMDDINDFFQSLIRDVHRAIDVNSDNTEAKEEDASVSDQPGVEPLELDENPLRGLYDIIIGPIAELLQGDELVIVPDGALCLAPYGALLDTNGRYLCESFRIRVLPSLTSLKLITDSPQEYHRRSGALLVGDPWVQDVTTKAGERRLHQLPCAKEEVQLIGKILKTVPLTGTEATKDEVLKRLSSVALVHIAAHGCLETGEIALAPNPTRASQIPNEDDYLLTINDVLSVDLRAKLVVLSCCHSGRGEIKAEGVVGIARAFMGAGARSVLVSLWAIDDEATLEFMKFFYQHLMEGRSASEALNQATKCMRESVNFSDTRYWAPFVLIGDDITLNFSDEK